MPTLLPPAKPRFAEFSINGTLAKRLRIASTDPFREPLSTTRMSAPGSSACSREARHARVSSKFFQLRMTINVRGDGSLAILSAPPTEVLDHLRVVALELARNSVELVGAPHESPPASRHPLPERIVTHQRHQMVGEFLRGAADQ